MVAKLVLSTTRLALINRRAQHIAHLISAIHGRGDGDGITLAQWREGCLSQPEILACFATSSNQSHQAPSAPPAALRGAPHPESPAARPDESGGGPGFTIF